MRGPTRFKAFKVDIHAPLGWSMQQYGPSIGPPEVRKVERFYALAREASGPKSTSSCIAIPNSTCPAPYGCASHRANQAAVLRRPAGAGILDSWMALRGPRVCR